MALPNTWVLFYVHEREELYDQQRLFQFFTGLAQRNCFVALESERTAQAIWRRYMVEEPELLTAEQEDIPFADALRPGVSESLRERSMTYVAQREEQLTLVARSMARSPLARGFTFSVTLSPTEGYLLCSIEQERFFNPKLDGLAKYRYWIRVLEETYACWRPFYAYEFMREKLPTANPSWEELRTRKVPLLHHLNMYGPELIQQIGRERLFNAPAWLIRELEGSGCLLIPEDPHDFSPTSSATYAEVAKYLGLPVVAQET